ncbi:hypothetical protein OAB94_02525 [Flavobacteriaceae bacterium]|nr:hypothetical protein [Flavobacteriaceae bacterium]
MEEQRINEHYEWNGLTGEQLKRFNWAQEYGWGDRTIETMFDFIKDRPKKNSDSIDLEKIYLLNK